MPPSADNTNKNNLGFTSVQAYTLAVITLAIGIAVGYFARGSAPAAVPNETAQAASVPAGMGGGAMGGAQLPGIGSAQPQQPASPEMLAKAAEPLLAIEYYEKALNVQPDNADVRTDMGTAYWYTGNPDKAIANFDKALAISPNHPGTLFNLGIVKWQGKKDPKGAIVAWEKLLQTNPDYPQKDQVQMLIERAKMHSAGATTTKG